MNLHIPGFTRTKAMAPAGPGRRSVTASMVVGGTLVVATSGVHFHLWETTYRHIPTIGPLFLLQALTGLALGLALVGWRRPILAVLGAGFMASSAGGLLLATTSAGLFGFRESLAAPFAGLILGIELVGLLVLAPAGIVAAARVAGAITSRRPAAVAQAPMPVVVAPVVRATPVVPAPVVTFARSHGSSSWSAQRPLAAVPAAE